jgi:hypothetical protein
MKLVSYRKILLVVDVIIIIRWVVSLMSSSRGTYLLLLESLIRELCSHGETLLFPYMAEIGGEVQRY